METPPSEPAAQHASSRTGAGSALLWVLVIGAWEMAASASQAAAPEAGPPRTWRPLRDGLGVARLRLSADAPDGLGAAALARLRASGSGQFSAAGLRHVLRVLQERQLVRHPSEVIVVDLRHEPHGFSGPTPVSWHRFNNALNADRDPQTAAADELARLQALPAGQHVEAAWLCKRDVGAARQVIYAPVSLFAAPGRDERTLVEGAGARYTRLPMIDHTGAPAADIVDQFVALALGRPAGSWLHLHCRKGKGRTTLFLAMLDMLDNAATLPLERIVARQLALGGTDLFADNPHDPDKGPQRRAFLRAFHAFCRQRVERPGLVFSAWLAGAGPR